ncbi:uncharacterized protein ARMOST_10387 [Armillaria ostoyae]|uniref:Uncharacterized protein n=1 Tax=Armillaria ostoyae TaxID=47428 RepID=A0A284RE81_ARMOS|nr:uncharacterized protein ARMOST_10387 [Armillaria ostoyae]
MNPDDIMITITAVIGGACLLSLFVALLVLAYANQLRRLLRIQRCPTPRPTTLPTQYVLPYVQPGPLVERVGPQPTYPPAQRRATYHQNFSDEFPPRNATLGPSNVPRTPPPTYPTEEAEDYGRYLRARYCTPSPHPVPIHTPNPQRAHFENAQTQIRALVLEQSLHHPGNASPIQIGTPNHKPPAPLVLHTAGTVRVGTPANLAPYSREDSDSDSSDYGGNKPVPEREDDDPLNAHGGDYEWPELGAIDRVILSPYRSQAWELHRLDIKQ